MNFCMSLILPAQTISGYTAGIGTETGDWGFGCKSPLQSPATACAYYSTCATPTIVLTTDASGQHRTAIERGFIVRWRSSDLPALLASTAATTAAAADGAEPPPQTGGLSTGARAGIGVGAGIAALVLLFLLGWWCVRRRRQGRRDGGRDGGDQAAEMPANARTPGFVELAAGNTTGKSPLQGREPREELDGTNIGRAELPADPVMAQELPVERKGGKLAELEAPLREK